MNTSYVRSYINTACRHTAARILAILTAALLLILALFPVTAIQAYATTAPELYADSAVLINADSGEILFDKNRMREMYPASTTKIMTVMLALENMDPEQLITVSADAAAQTGSKLGLVEGEQISVKDACYATMLLSANDAAWALAEAVSGDTGSFAQLMNDTASDLGAMSTYFVTPNGLPNDSHVTSAIDMAKFTQAALKNETFRQIVSSYSYNVSATNMSGVRTVNNTNRLLADTGTVNVYGTDRTYKYDGCIGVKTGHTNAAGYCLVAAAERDGVTLIGVIFHSTADQQYPDMIKLLDFGFTGYAPKTVVKAGDIVGQTKVKYGSPGKVDVAAAEDVTAMVEADENGDPVGNLKSYSYTINVKELDAPVEKGAVAGTLTLYKGEDELGSYDLVTTEDVDMSFLHSLFKSSSWIKGYVLMIGAVAVVSAVGYALLSLQMKRSAEKRRAERKKRRQQRWADEESKKTEPEENAGAENSAETGTDAAGENDGPETSAETGEETEAGPVEGPEPETEPTAGAGSDNETGSESVSAGEPIPSEEIITGNMDMSDVNMITDDEMPDFGTYEEIRETQTVDAAVENIMSVAASDPDRVSDLFNRLLAEQDAKQLKQNVPANGQDETR